MTDCSEVVKWPQGGSPAAANNHHMWWRGIISSKVPSTPGVLQHQHWWIPRKCLAQFELQQQWLLVTLHLSREKQQRGASAGDRNGASCDSTPTTCKKEAQLIDVKISASHPNMGACMKR